MSPDIVNGTFEFVGGILCWANACRLYRDKVIKGVMWQVTGFFTAWGFWNLLYYPALGQWVSFAGGVFLVVGNAAWVVLALKYKGKDEIKSEYCG